MKFLTNKNTERLDYSSNFIITEDWSLKFWIDRWYTRPLFSCPEYDDPVESVYSDVSGDFGESGDPGKSGGSDDSGQPG